MRIDRVPRREFLGIGFDPLEPGAILRALGRQNADDEFAFVVTPNVDHVVRARRAADGGDQTLFSIYRSADWCLCDSRVLAGLARLRGVVLPVTTGSDLTKRILDEVAGAGDVIAIVGGTRESSARLKDLYRDLQFVQHCPPMGLRHRIDAIEEAVAFVVNTRARFTFLAVGSPQQEIIAQHVAKRPDARGVALCVGASLDFVVGAERRAPRWMQKSGLEWAFRLAVDPRRKWRRYLVDGPPVFILAWRWHPNSE